MGFRPEFDWVWIAGMIITSLNAVLWWTSGQKHMRRRPELRGGYVKLVRGVLIWGNIPWLVMGLAMVVGGAEVEEFKFGSHNPFVMVSNVSVLLILALGTNWIIRGGGAGMVVKHPGLFNVEIAKPITVKVIWLIAAATAVVGMVRSG